MKATLSCSKLKKIYNKREVVKSSSIEVKQGEIVGLLGPNGAGKTTTFYMIVGLVRPNGGDVFLDSTNITRFPMYKRARLGIGYLPQEASVFRNLTVEENILSVLEFSSLSKAERKERTDMMLEDLNIAGIRKSMGYMHSPVVNGGVRKLQEPYLSTRNSSCSTSHLPELTLLRSKISSRLLKDWPNETSGCS